LEENITDYIKTITSYLEENNIQYVIVGGLAVNAIGRSRMTMGLDIIIEHKKLNKQGFVKYLSQNGFDITLNDLEGLEEKTHCTFYPNNSSFRIDLKGNYTELEDESINMSIRTRYDGIDVQIDSPINLILYKLKFGSEQDIEDAFAVYAYNKDSLNDEVLMKRSKIIGVEDKIKAFLKEANELIQQETGQMNENSK